MDTFMKIIVIIIILIVAVLLENLFDRVPDSSWWIGLLKIVVIFVIISAVGISLKWVSDYIGLLN
jgi:hypothetical protein